MRKAGRGACGDLPWTRRCTYLPVDASELTSVRLLQTRVMFGEAAVPGNEACGCAYAADSGFVIRADALRTVRWLPEHSEAIGHALGKELPRCGGAFAAQALKSPVAAPHAPGGSTCLRQGGCEALP